MGQKMIRFMDAWVGTGFVWGRTDCAIMILRYLDHANNWSLVEQFEGRYNSEKSATNFSISTMNMRDFLINSGFTNVSRGFEREGDVLLSTSEVGLYHSYIDVGARVFSAHPKHGVKLFPKRAINKNYEVLRCPLN